MSRVKCLFFRRAKELNRPRQCDVNLANWYSGSLPSSDDRDASKGSKHMLVLYTKKTSHLSNDDSDGNDNKNGKRAI